LMEKKSSAVNDC